MSCPLHLLCLALIVGESFRRGSLCESGVVGGWVVASSGESRL